MEKRKLAVVILIVLTVGIVIFVGKQRKASKFATKLLESEVQAFFPKNDLCKDQEREIKKCDLKKGKYSCSTAHCFLPDELQMISYYQAKCLEEKLQNTEDCLNTSAKNFKFISDWQKADDKGCMGYPKDQKRCNDFGMQWNCKTGACYPTTANPPIFQLYYGDCNGDVSCQKAMIPIQKKLCKDQFGNEECMPNEKIMEKNQMCENQEPKTKLKTWSPKFEVCADETLTYSYFRNFKMCYMNRSHPHVLKPQEMSKVFASPEECVANLSKEVNSLPRNTP